MLDCRRKERDILKINFEFRKGIFFIRLIGNLNKDTYLKNENELVELITLNKFKYVVINTNNLSSVDLAGINCITKMYYLVNENKSNLVICDKFKIISTLLNNNVPNIEDELEVL